MSTITPTQQAQDLLQQINNLETDLMPNIHQCNNPGFTQLETLNKKVTLLALENITSYWQDHEFRTTVLSCKLRILRITDRHEEAAHPIARMILLFAKVLIDRISPSPS